MLLWNTATGDLFHKTMLHSFIPYKGNHLKIHPHFSTQRLSKAPDPSETWPWCQHRSHSHQVHWGAMGTAQAQINSWEMQFSPCWTHYPCCQHQGTQLAKCTQTRFSWCAKTTLAALKKNLSDSWKRQILPRMSAAGEAHSQTQRRSILTQAVVQM